MIWRLCSGAEPTPHDWCNPDLRCIGVEIRGAAEGPAEEAGDHAAYLIFNAGGACEAHLPAGAWERVLDSADPDGAALPMTDASTCLAAQSLQVFIQSLPQEPS
jgi:glycogen operon protein